MPDQSESRVPDPVRQVRQHLDSLRAAGVDWLPAAKGPVVVPTLAAHSVPAAAEPEPAPALQTSLFRIGAETSPEGDLDTPERRRHELEVLAQNVAGCTRCAELASTRTQTVFGVGKVGPELCFIGEAPGYNEDVKGEPFVGAAGELLNRIIAACGLKREEVYICNVIKCRPPGNRLPLPHEAANCREHLGRQLELVRPKFLCALGGCAAQNLLDTKTGITKLRGRFYDFRGIPLLCTFHPAFLLRNPHSKKDVWEDMKLLLARMGRPVPKKQ